MALSVRGSSPFVLSLASLGTKLTVAFDILMTAVNLFLPSARLKVSGRKVRLKTACSTGITCASSY